MVFYFEEFQKSTSVNSILEGHSRLFKTLTAPTK
uniref:Uncharacterized protein n=1 Tax=Arundo donax TaxID=35708 RepID=A0A0A9B3U5_ARUDO